MVLEAELSSWSANGMQWKKSPGRGRLNSLLLFPMKLLSQPEEEKYLIFGKVGDLQRMMRLRQKIVVKQIHILCL